MLSGVELTPRRGGGEVALTRTDSRDPRVDSRRGSRAHERLAVAGMLVLLAIAILALAGARRAVLGQEPKACDQTVAQAAERVAGGNLRC